MADAAAFINERFDALANSDLNEFRQFFKRLRKQFPEQAAEACLWYIASHGHDPAAQSMAFWLAGESTYISVLLDTDALPAEIARKAVQVVKQIDPQFVLKFTKHVTAVESPPVIVRALSLLPAIGDYSILISWLRGLAQSPDERVRSRSAKLLCELRPNKSLIQRQMQSKDPRVRAGAMEAIWYAKREDARILFQAAVSDPHHRVVGNALVGLYLLGDTEILNKVIELCAHPEPLFRAAMAWALGFVKDVRAIPTLQELTRDSSEMVRKRSLNSLLLLESLKPAEQAVSEVAVSEPAVPTQAPEKEVETAEPGFNLFLFR